MKINKYDVTMVYLIPIIIHFRLSNYCKIFRKCSWRVILLIFAKNIFFPKNQPVYHLKQSPNNQFLVLLSSICMLYLYSQSYLELVKFNIFWYFYFNTFKLHKFKGKPKVNIQVSYPSK